MNDFNKGQVAMMGDSAALLSGQIKILTSGKLAVPLTKEEMNTLVKASEILTSVAQALIDMAHK